MWTLAVGLGCVGANEQLAKGVWRVRGVVT